MRIVVDYRPALRERTGIGEYRIPGPPAAPSWRSRGGGPNIPRDGCVLQAFTWDRSAATLGQAYTDAVARRAG